MRNMTVCVTACLTALAGLAATLSPLRANAQEASPSTRFFDSLFGVNRPQLDAQVQQQAQNAWIQAGAAIALLLYLVAVIVYWRQLGTFEKRTKAAKKWAGIGIIGTAVCGSFHLGGLLPDLLGITACIGIVGWIAGAIRRRVRQS